MISMTNPRSCRRSVGVAPLAALLAAGILLGACDLDSLLDVPTPDLVPGDVAADPENLASLRNGVLFEFARAYTGPAGSNDYPGIVGITGVFTDELWYSSTFPDMREFDRRAITAENAGLLTVFRYIHRARNWAEVAAEQYADSPQANSPSHSLVTSLAGYAHFFLAENFCSGVPLSRTSIRGALEFGPGRPTNEILEIALDRFTGAEGIAQAAGSSVMINLARVGRARALRGLDRLAEAAGVAATVSPGFFWMVEYSEDSSGQSNGIWGQINTNLRSSLASEEGTANRGQRYFNRQGMDAASLTIDPRVPISSRDAGLSTGLPVFRAGKFSTRGSDAPLATYVEAQLILAEHLSAAGMSADYLPVLNALRANVAALLPTVGIVPQGQVALEPLVDPGERDARILQLYAERAMWLHLSAQRLGDLRRLIRVYGFGEADVFPTGNTITNLPFGNDVNFPVPLMEGNNPEFDGQCLDRLP
jgi:hypothetical protein